MFKIVKKGWARDVSVLRQSRDVQTSRLGLISVAQYLGPGLVSAKFVNVSVSIK